MVYVAGRYLCGIERGELLNGLRRPQHSTEQPAHDTAPVRCLGSMILIGDDACYCPFEAPSPVAVIDVNRRVGLPVDRIVAAVAVTPTKGESR